MLPFFLLEFPIEKMATPPFNNPGGPGIIFGFYMQNSELSNNFMLLKQGTSTGVFNLAVKS